jgi:hypothetical protein
LFSGIASAIFISMSFCACQSERSCINTCEFGAAAAAAGSGAAGVAPPHAVTMSGTMRMHVAKRATDMMCLSFEGAS